jgi:predicted butyrate kinase (DUF1464 family)
LNPLSFGFTESIHRFKELLCSGGVSYIAGQPDLPPKDLVAPALADDRSRLAWEAFMESLVKGVAAKMTVVPAPREILTSGRLCRIPEIRQEMVRRLSLCSGATGEGLCPVG